MDAIVTAGGRIAGEFAAREGLTIKALLRLNGKTLLERTLCAIRGSHHVDRICVVGPWELEVLARKAGADLFVDEGITGMDNLISGIKALEAQGPVLCAASDLPFLRPEDVDDVVDRTPRDAQLGYVVLTRQQWDAVFPGAYAMFVPFSDGQFTGGCVHVLDAGVLRRIEPMAQRAFAARRSAVGMAGLLGVGLTLRLLCGLCLGHRLGPSTEDARRRAESVLGCRCAIVRGCSPHVAADVDSWEDWQYACRRDGRDASPESAVYGVGEESRNG